MLYYNKEALGSIRGAMAQNFTQRRLRTWLGFSAAWASLRGVVRAGQFVDDAFYPAWREQRVEQPVFIFANGRSGTTMLHRLMAQDETNFASLKLYQSLLNAVTYRRVVDAVGRTPGVGRLGEAGVDLLNRRVFRGWQGIHEMGLDKAEEDEATFAIALETASVSLLNPFLQGYEEFGWLDGRSDERNELFMAFYESVVKKHLFASGGNRRFLNKNVFFAPRVRTMLNRFPDARFIYLIRHPYEALPSWLNMFYEKWKTHSPELPYDSPQALALARMGFRYYRYAMQLIDELPEQNLQVVRYSDLVANPQRVVENLYAWMGLEPSPAYRRWLNRSTEQQKRYRSAHRYSLAQFGIQPDWVHRELQDIFERFDFKP